MKQGSTDLFSLVKSMTKTEKRFFQIFAGRHYSSDNQYFRLFLMIDKQAEYDEKKLAVQFSSKKSKTHFAVIKKQLYENILEALHRYDEFSQPAEQIRRGVHFCELLLKKGLFDQCEKQIKKYERFALRFEKFENLIELQEIRKRLMNKKQFTGISYSEIDRLQHEQNKYLDLIAVSGDYWKKSNRIFKLHYEKKISAGGRNSELKELMEDEKFADIKNASTFKAKLDYFQVNALDAFVNNEIEKAYGLNMSFLKLLDEEEHLKLLHADRYFSVLNNYLIDSLILRRFDQLLSGIQILRTLPEKPEFRHIQNLEANVFRQSHLLELNYFISTNKFEKAVESSARIEKGLKKFGDKIALTHIITMRYLLSYAQFCRREFADALDQVLNILNTRNAEAVTDIFRDTRIMQMLCHFELGDFMLVESMLISIQRSVLGGKLKFRTYKILFRYIRDAIQKLQKPDIKLLASKFKQLESDKNESQLFNNFNYAFWADEISRQLK